jgi:hypothetical protein
VARGEYTVDSNGHALAHLRPTTCPPVLLVLTRGCNAGGLCLWLQSHQQIYRAHDQELNWVPNESFPRVVENIKSTINYLGEILLYGAFVVMAQSWLYWTFLWATWSHVFLVNIYWKELSLMR